MNHCSLIFEPYLEAVTKWPNHGRHILAQYDDTSVIVYQAYKPSIAAAAVRDGHFLNAPEFSINRMTWIKPGFLWMQFRCGWATKKDQERVLTIRIKRDGFDAILDAAVRSKAPPDVSADEYREVLDSAQVVLQWDPDHNPDGSKIIQRRAIQLGVKGSSEIGKKLIGGQYVVGIEDITEKVKELKQRMDVEGIATLMVPRERMYSVINPITRDSIRVDQSSDII